jgi:hypothetical protein
MEDTDFFLNCKHSSGKKINTLATVFAVGKLSAASLISVITEISNIKSLF